MKNKFLSILLVLASIIVGFNADAKEVDVKTAAEIGVKFIRSNTSLDVTRTDNLMPITTYRTAKDKPCFYVFNIGEGFVIVSAQDCATPILGYSTESNIDLENIPESMEVYLKSFVEQIEYGVEDHLKADAEIAEQWRLVTTTGQVKTEKSRTSVEPLLTDTWSQDCYYNMLCPEDVNGRCGHVFTGCTCTSMGEILHYWNHPQVGKSSNSYTPNGYPEQSVNFGETIYEWANMPDKLYNYTPDSQKLAVATLLWHCGVAVEASYGPKSTGAWPSTAAYRDYFRYSDDIFYQQRNNDADWMLQVKSNLDNGFPIQYVAWTSTDVGHTFVCDGYNDNDYLHFNWGWGGSGNGYFALTALNVSGYEFNFNHSAVFNIHPVQHNVSATSNNSEFGTVSGTGTYNETSTVTLTATPNAGYAFINWTENNNVVSTDVKYSFMVESDRNLVTNFEIAPLTITALEDNTVIGLDINGSPNISTLQYSYDGEIWNNITSTTTFNTLQNGEYIKFRSENQVSNSLNNYIKFKDYAGSYETSGNINSLINYRNVNQVELEGWAFKSLFSGCTRLKDASELILPATELSYKCYSSMFWGCTSLATSPELPATTLAEQCYESMFSNCGSLTKTPELPAETLNDYCYSNMFLNCTSLVEVTELPALIMAYRCYENMFMGCTSLKEAPELPAPELAESCYSCMFQGCISLTKAPYDLPATEGLAEFCYFNMFRGCTSLTKAPELPAEILTYGCYNEMFRDCTSLRLVVTYATSWESDYAGFWLGDVSPIGDFYNLGGNGIPRGQSGIPYGWTEHNSAPIRIMAMANDWEGKVSGDGLFVEGETCTLTATPNPGYTFANWTENNIEVSTDAEYSFTVENDRNLVANFIVTPDYLTLTALENNTIIGLNVNGSPNISTLQYSYNGTTWYNITGTTTFKTLQNGQYIKFRSENQVNIDCYYGTVYGAPREPDSYINFTDTDGLYKVSGNINTLINYHDVNNAVLGECAFAWLFEFCYRLIDASELVLPATTLSEACYARMFAFTSLTAAPELPATVLAASCYSEMFTNCTSLTTAPELPATTLANWCYGGMFFFCESLTEAPELPATTLTEGCYTAMFRDCKLLTEAPALPATTLTSECYVDMFSGCSSLTEAPVLPSTTLAANCYSQMFSECASLETAPELPATTLTTGCYNGMFSGCTSLKIAPELPATTLALACYSGMFGFCESLTEAPELPATTLTEQCYSWMFAYCTLLGEAPELPATSLATSCYLAMFYGCSSLNSVTTHATTWDTDNAGGWLYGVAANGDFYDLGSAYIPIGESGIPEGWTVHNPNVKTISALPNDGNFGTVSGAGSYFMYDFCLLTATPNPGYTFVNWTENNIEVSTDVEYSFTVENDRYLVANFEVAIDYLTLTALEDNTIVGLNINGTPNISTLQYSYDGVNWNVITESITFNTLLNGQYIKFRSENQVCTANVGSSDYIHHYIQFKDEDGSYKASGNMNTLIDYQDVDNVELGIFAFYKMFQDCTRLTDASELLLPSMTMDLYCYQSMFNGCTSLTSAPALPAMTMTSGCYLEMFKGCSSLTEAPELPATNLGADCYQEMFNGCTSLTEAPELPATDLGHGCYKEMFKGCTSLMEAPELPATTLAGYCYYYMFSNCVSLTEVPSLPATTLTRGCYYGMFNGCTSLTEAPELPATTLAESCYQGMFNNCTSLTSASELPATTMAKSCYQSMFSWCSNITSAPALPATTLADYCYTQMFYNCTSLTFAPALPATTLAGHCYSNMFIYCTSLAEASALPATVMADNCYFSMFNGCTSLTSAPALTVMTTASYCCCQMFSGCTGLADASEVSLPAMAMADHCYYNMFCDCRSLTSAPALPATTLADYCYWQMFSNCESLTETPALPATTLAEGCYRSMFNGCRNITSAPELPATTLAEHCYHSMFYNCLELNSTVSLPATTLANSCYYNMFYCCWSLKTVITHATNWNIEDSNYWLYAAPSTGDFYNLGGADIPRGASGIPEGWKEHTTAPVTITASANNANFGTVSGGGSFVEGETCTLTATPNSGYTFVNWTENNVEVSTDAEYSFTVEADRNLVANFTASSPEGNHWNPNPYLYTDNMNVVAEIYMDNVLQTSSDIEIGAFCNEEVRGSGRVEYEGAPFNKYIVNLTIHGVADDNIIFKVFNHQTNEEVSCRIGQSLTFIPNQIEGNLINPYAIECFTTADIVTTVNPSIGGTVSGDGTYQVGQTVTLTATASDYYRFVNWTENDEEVSSSESYSFMAYDNRSLVANFEINNHWIPDPSLYTYSMTIITEIQVDGMTRTSGILRIGGREQDYNEIEVGAFCGDEIRGSAMLTYMPEPIDKFMVSIIVYGEENENIAFRLYNHETATEYNLNAPEPIPFVPNATLGSFDEPYVLNFLSTVNISASANPVEAGTITGIGNYEIGSAATLTAVPNDGFAFKNWTNNGVVVSTETSYSFPADEDGVLVANFDYLQSKELAAGWNWYSTYVAVSGTEGFNVLTTNLGTTADVIKSQTKMSMYYDEYNVWSGTLTTIENEQMYMIKMNTANELEIVGGLADLAGTQLTLHPGWNWISFPSNIETSLTDALAGFTPDDGDCIKSQFNMALYYGGEYNVWNGALNTLTPGQGFMYKNNSSSIKVLTYSTAGSKYITDVNITTDGNHWQPNIHAYPDNMNITAVLSVNGMEQASENMEVGVFSGNECRGSGRLVYNELVDRYVTYLTVYGNDGDNLSFRLYDAATNTEYDGEVGFSSVFAPNAIVGSIFNPYVIDFGLNNVSENGMSEVSIYPNPARHGDVVNIGFTCERIQVVNSLGVVIKEYTNTNKIEGIDTAGMYYILLINGNSISYNKLVVE